MISIKMSSCLLLLGLAVCGCSSDESDASPVANVTVTIDGPVTLAMDEGDTRQLSATVSDGSSVVWTSSDPQVAVVSDDGLVTAIGYGKAQVKASAGSASSSRTVLVRGYTLVWSDEFDGQTLDDTKWNIETGAGGWGNNEKQCYTGRSENLRVSDGNLEIQARKESYSSASYTSARITTKNKASFTFGKMEARIKLPSGGGTWPAFWMLGYGSWPYCGEIDIMEHVGNNPLMTSFALHTQQANGMKGNNWNSQKTNMAIEGEWHTFGVVWEDNYQNTGMDAIVFTIDGVEYAKKRQQADDKSEWPFNDNFFIILNMAIGGNMGGTINDDIFESDVVMYVDYVRVYQKNYPEL